MPRPLGSPNRVTAKLREKLSEIISDEFNNLPETLAECDPKDRVKLIIQLTGYCVPKLRSVDLKADEINELVLKLAGVEV